MENQVIDLDFTQWLNFVNNILKSEAILWWCKHIYKMTIQTLVIVINFNTKCEKKCNISLWEQIICNNKISKIKKTYNSCKLIFKIHEPKKQERHTLEEKGCTQNSKKESCMQSSKNHTKT
jgi:hypothetical protein